MSEEEPKPSLLQKVKDVDQLLMDSPETTHEPDLGLDTYQFDDRLIGPAKLTHQSGYQYKAPNGEYNTAAPLLHIDWQPTANDGRYSEVAIDYTEGEDVIKFALHHANIKLPSVFVTYLSDDLGKNSATNLSGRTLDIPLDFGRVIQDFESMVDSVANRLDPQTRGSIPTSITSLLQ